LLCGWKLRVKWEGHPTITTERLSSIVSRVTDRRILEEIDLRKAEYQGRYATVPSPPEIATVAVPAPTRVQPARSSRAHPVFLLSTDDSRADTTLFEFACSILHVESGKKTQSLHQLEDVH